MSFTPTDIELFQGSFAQLDLTVRDSGGNLLDLRGYSIKSQIRSQPGVSGALLLAFDVQDIGLSAGMARLFAAASATVALPDPVTVPGRAYAVAYWDVFVAPTGATGTMDQQYAAGRVFVYPRVTQR